MAKPALLASRAITPALKPNHKKPPVTAIHAEHPTPGSKLPSATKREQALALEKHCGTKTLLDCGSPAAALGKPALLASRAITPALKPNHKKPPVTAIHTQHPTPGSKLPVAAKREQALALEKHCGAKTLLDCGSPAAALAKPACWRRAPSPQCSSPTTRSPR